MKHFTFVSKERPAPAFYYQLSLTEKILELATLASFLDSFVGAVKNVFDAAES
jgi:hypothetical protein